MSRASGSTPGSVSLFPFLAVLVCAMGALILLLIAMTQKIRLQAIAKELAGRLPVASIASPDQATARLPVRRSRPAVVPPEEHVVSLPPSPAIDTPLEPDPAAVAAQRARQAAWEQELRDLHAERDRILTALQQRRSSSLRTKTQLQLEQEELERLKHAQHRQRLETQKLTEVEQALRDKQTQVEQRIALTKRNLDAAKRQLSQASGAYALVPYDGQSGTYRRPIFIECTDEGLRLLPENIFLDPETLDGFTEAYNPLLAATQALTQHWNRERERAGNHEPEPYVLLLVRPSGTIAYYVARKLLTRSNTPFGYELVEEDWKLDFPEADPVAKALAHDAVTKTLRAKAEVLASMGGQPRRHGEQVAAVQGAKRTFPEIVELDESAGVTRRSTTTGDSRSGQSGSSSGNSGNSAATGPATIGLGDGSSRPARGPAASLSPDEIQTELATAARANSVRPSGSTASAPLGRSAAGQRGLPQESGQWRTDYKPGAEPGGLLDASRSRPLDGPEGHAGFTPDSMLQEKMASGGERTAPQPASGPSEAGRSPSHPRSANGTSNSGIAKNRNPTSTDGDLPPAAAQSDVVEHRPQPTAAGNEPASATSSPADSGPQGAAGAATSRNTFSARESETAGAPSIQQRGGAAGRSGPRDAKRWSAPGRGTIGLEKKIEVHVLPDKILVGPYDVTVRIVRGETKEELVNKMMDGIERSAATWGRPPANFYWLPSIKFVVFPGGSQHYERIHGALREWGVTSQVEYAGSEIPKTSKIPIIPKVAKPIP